ncbi:MAG TPA: MarR family transcriptional regulator [Candidatus Dormibacteraeota bacterium]|nr:MarR family transcriptional regulator [Candidatus Dormibacteraeota bacterium]
MPDQVDRLVIAWRRARPDLDVAPLEVLSRVVRLARHLALARKQAFARQELPEWQFDVLAALRRADPPHELTPGELLEETLVSSGTMTHRLDELETAGLVTRQPDPADGRVVRVRLAPAGRKAVDAALTALLDRERELLDPLSAKDRRQLAALLRRLLLPFDAPDVTR